MPSTSSPDSAMPESASRPKVISANRGMLLVPGEPRRLRAILGTDRFSSIYLRAGGVVSNLTYELMLGCDEAPAGIASWNRRRDALQVVS